MIDDAFLRQVAALQANLKMLESQSDTLSDLADMKELRLYKARLVDYIEAHSKAGHLPPDPFQVIQQRLVAVSEFFTAADKEYKRLNSWRADWINSVPAVGLTELQSARTELAARVAEVQQIQERLRQRLSPLDWDTSSSAVDLHPELLACALKWFPPIPERRRDLYQFTSNEGTLAKKAAAHFTAMGLRIENLIALHANHMKALVDTDHHLSNDSFRSAEKSFQNLGKDRFSDIDYSLVESRLQKAMGVLAQFKSLDSSLKQLLEKGEYKAVKAELSQLHRLIEKPDSELGREALVLLQKMESRLNVAHKAHKSRKTKQFTLISIFVVGLVAFSLYIIIDNAKAKNARVIALAKAEAAWVKSAGNRAGEESFIEIAPGVDMNFCWCPAGKFTMGSTKSEADLSDSENQIEVTLSRGFWMAKTEVTQAQWQAVMGGNPSEFKGANLPVENISWHDTQVFLKKLNAIAGNSVGGQIVLPTEAQWEYACRAGETAMYSGGTLDEVAWYDVNSGRNTHPVGTKKPNAWGLHDMSGNVWEWCADWHDDRLSGGTDPNGASSGVCRVLRGGSWNYDAAHCRAAFRSWHFPNSRSNELSFRPALVPSK